VDARVFNGAGAATPVAANKTTVTISETMRIRRILMDPARRREEEGFVGGSLGRLGGGWRPTCTDPARMSSCSLIGNYHRINRGICYFAGVQKNGICRK